jgi:hypothetical protein
MIKAELKKKHPPPVLVTLHKALSDAETKTEVIRGGRVFGRSRNRHALIIRTEERAHECCWLKADIPTRGAQMSAFGCKAGSRHGKGHISAFDPNVTFHVARSAPIYQ